MYDSEIFSASKAMQLSHATAEKTVEFIVLDTPKYATNARYTFEHNGNKYSVESEPNKKLKVRKLKRKG
jgi:hypothetical protein